MFSFFNTKDYELEKIIMINSVIPKLEKKISQFSVIDCSESTIDLINEKKNIIKCIKYYYNL
jgi:hypothetical protein